MPRRRQCVQGIICAKSLSGIGSTKLHKAHIEVRYTGAIRLIPGCSTNDHVPLIVSGHERRRVRCLHRSTACVIATSPRYNTLPDWRAPPSLRTLQDSAAIYPYENTVGSFERRALVWPASTIHLANYLAKRTTNSTSGQTIFCPQLQTLLFLVVSPEAKRRQHIRSYSETPPTLASS